MTEPLNPREIAALAEAGLLQMKAAAHALAALTFREVEVSPPEVGSTSWEALRAEYPVPCVVVRVHYVSGLEGSNVLIIPEEDARQIVGLMLGEEVPAGSLGEMELSALAEAMNQMMGASTTALSDRLGRRIEISPPEMEYKTIEEAAKSLHWNGAGNGAGNGSGNGGGAGGGATAAAAGGKGAPTARAAQGRSGGKAGTGPSLVRVAFELNIQGGIVSRIVQVLTQGFARSFAWEYLRSTGAESPEPETAGIEPEADGTSLGDEALEEVRRLLDGDPGAPEQGPEAPQSGLGMLDEEFGLPTDPAWPRIAAGASAAGRAAASKPGPKAGPGPAAQPAPGAASRAAAKPAQGGAGDRGLAHDESDRVRLELIKKVSVPVSVRLGRARLMLRDVLELTRGSVIPLDTVEGQPVEVLVSGTVVARGEVVVVREHFGVRITELLREGQSAADGE